MSTNSSNNDISLRVMPEQWLDPEPVTSWFSEDQPLEIDLGCGKGRFLLARAAACKGVNFLGIERLLGRVNKLERKAQKAGLNNVRICRVEGYYATRFLIPRCSVRTYYIFFPDPWPKRKHHQHRIMNVRFVDALYETLEPGGIVHFATDHLPYFYEVLSQLKVDERFEAVAPFQPDDAERTDFELLFLGDKPIGRYSMVKRWNAVNAGCDYPD